MSNGSTSVHARRVQGRRARHISEMISAPARCTVRQLTKRYGALQALRNASFDVHAGEVLGLLGPNGSGKTTLMSCMAGTLASDGGDVAFQDDATVWFLPDGVTPWADQPANWLLPFAAHVFGVRSNDIYDVTSTLRVNEFGVQRIGTLSKGQHKRLLLALALLQPSSVVLLDEPFDGLDVRLTRDVIALLQRHARAGRSIIVSLHVMYDAARVCDRMVLLNDGATIAQGSERELRERTGLADGPFDEVFLALV